MDNLNKYNVIITNNTYSNNGSEEELKVVKKNKKRYKSHCINSWKKQIKYFINVFGLDGYLENH